MPFQPYDNSEKLYYPSTQPPVGPGLYSTNGLSASGDRLYSFNVGDYAYPSLTPIPHVEITIFGVASTTATATVYRRAGGRRFPVRGQIGVYAVGGLNVVDWEAPFGIELAYQAEQFDADGNNLGFTQPFITQLDVAESWVQNPFEPVNARQVTFAEDAARTVPRPVDVNTVWAQGAGAATVIARQRQGVTETPASFFTATPGDGDAVRNMIGDSYDTPSTPPVLVIRTGAKQKRMRYPQPFYAAVNHIETDVDGQHGNDTIRWDGTATEVQPPAPALVPALLSLSDIDASYATLQDIDNHYGELFAIDRDYSLAGTT